MRVLSPQRALALNCHSPINEKGAEAEDWRQGKPVRVVRNMKGGKHSKYAPAEGNRYDGIYKVSGALSTYLCPVSSCQCPETPHHTVLSTGGEVLAREREIWLPCMALSPSTR